MMKKTQTINLRSMKGLGLLFAGLATFTLTLLLLASSVFAGGPANRPTFKSKKPADYVVFNAITDNPEHGDERNFVLIREAGVGTYVNEIKLQPGKEYEVYSYFHNNAKSRLNTGEGKGIARNVRMSADVPSTIKPGQRGKISTSITASNANPQRVWDEAYITSDTAASIRYVPASAVVHSGGKVNGQKLSTSLFTPTGTFLGYRALNGALPGCADYAGYVIYRIKIDQPSFNVKKEVAPTGTTNWGKQITTKPSGKADFRITYKNAGTTNQNNVTVKDALPKGMSYVKGSTKLVNKSNPNGKVLSDEVTKNGVNIGNYGPGVSATVTFSAIVSGNVADYVCGKNTLTNNVSVITGNGTKNDSAKVVVEVECKPTECKPGIPEGDERCEDTPPVVPDELPTTGPAQIIAGILGVALVSLGVAYWIRSRNEYKKALAGFTEDFADEPKEHLLEAKNNVPEKHSDNYHR